MITDKIKQMNTKTKIIISAIAVAVLAAAVFCAVFSGN